jgi:ParB family chromosome partitioning protein
MKLLMIDRDKIKFEGYRLRFKSGREDIEDMVNSIKSHGLLCPIIVSKKNGYFQLIAGERRLYAMDQLGWEKIPAIDKENEGGADILIKGLVENIVRLNLSPLERAMAMQEIIETYKYTQEKLAEKLGVDRSTAAHFLRMIQILHPQVLKYVHESSITFGHAKVLMKLKDQEAQLKIANRIVIDGLTITQTALLVDQARPPSELTPEEKELNAVERDIERGVGPKWGEEIFIRQGKKKEQLTVDFTDRENLKQLLLKILEAL